MKISRALLVSVAATFALLGVLSFFFGRSVFGLVLLLPLGFLWNRRSGGDNPRDDQPIHPR